MPVALPVRALRPRRRAFLPALALAVVALFDDTIERRPHRFLFDAWLADMERDEAGGWRLWIQSEPCGYSKSGGILELYYRGELAECPRLSAVAILGPLRFRWPAWPEVDRVVIHCRRETDPHPCPHGRSKDLQFE
jgi:hypothetical protein